MSGTSHWSVSAMIQIDEKPRLIYELACRAKQIPEYLGSKYLLDTDYVETEQGIGLKTEFGETLQLLANNAAVNRSAIEENKTGNLTFVPAENLGIGTIQWKYEIVFG